MDAKKPEVSVIVSSPNHSSRSWFKFGSRTTTIVISAVLLVVLIVGLGYVVAKKHHGMATGSICSDSVLRAASKAIDTDNQDKFASYQKDIMTRSGYEKDPNCLYVLMRMAMVANDTSAARKYLTDLQEVATGNTQYSPAITTTVYGLKDSEQIVSGMEQHDQSSQEVDNNLNQLMNQADRKDAGVQGQ